MDSKEIFCKKCEAKLPDENSACPKCGSKAKFFKVTLYDTATATESFGIRQKVKGFKKFMVEFISRHKPSGDIKKHPDGVIEERRIDKKNKTYFQKVIDKRTGKESHFEEMSLSEHK